MSKLEERKTAKINIAGLARTYGPKAIQRLAKALDDEDSRVAISAAAALLDRGYGKATQPIEHRDGEDRLTDAELIAAIREAALGGMDEAGENTGLTH